MYFEPFSVLDIHDQRLKQLRTLEAELAEDNWKYTPIEKILGLHFSQ